MTFLIQQTLIYAVPLMIVALAGVFAERSGIINLALEGIMVFGAFIGVWFVRIVQTSDAILSLKQSGNWVALQGVELLTMLVAAAFGAQLPGPGVLRFAERRGPRIVVPADVGGHRSDLRPVAPGHRRTHIALHGLLAARFGRRGVVKPAVGRGGFVPAFVGISHLGELLQHGDRVLGRPPVGERRERLNGLPALARAEVAVAQIVERVGQVIPLRIALHIAAQRLRGSLLLSVEVEFLCRGERQRVARKGRQVALQSGLGGVVEIGVGIALRNVDLADRLHRAPGF